MEDLQKITDEQLLEKYRTGKKWLIDREQITGTIRNSLGFLYDHDKWMAGLAKLEAIMDELNRRKIAY